jgi:4-hydroxybenzoate polyprenyltransferase
LNFLPAFLKTIRPLNLFIIALSQSLVRYCIILPAYNAEYLSTKLFPEHLSKIEFGLLVFATLLIAAGGNIINDVYDVQIDEVNKPGKNLIGKEISARRAASAAYLFFFLGSVIGVSLGVKNNLFGISLLFPFSAATLYMYSSYYKKKLLIGNILVALLSAFTILIAGLFETHYFSKISIWLRGNESMQWISGAAIILLYSLFAFLLSLIREVIKDAEDINGDKFAQCKTFPIVFGIKKTKIFISSLIILTLGIMGYFLQYFFSNSTEVNVYYLLLTFAIPFLALLYLIINASEEKDFYYASLFTKMIMLLGVLSMIPFYYFFM